LNQRDAEAADARKLQRGARLRLDSPVFKKPLSISMGALRQFWQQQFFWERNRCMGSFASGVLLETTGIICQLRSLETPIFIGFSNPDSPSAISSIMLQRSLKSAKFGTGASGMPGSSYF
jgi:hypothetical protein